MNPVEQETNTCPNETETRRQPRVLNVKDNPKKRDKSAMPAESKFSGSSKNIGQFILGEKLGEGTFGVVRLGTHILTGEKVAVKILEKVKILEQADKVRVEREIKILKYLRHNNIIQLYSVIQTVSTIYLIMEYANGKELFDYIVSKKRLTEQEACRFFQQIIAGTEYLHKLRIVHRDLKPENLLLDHKKDIKIADFGLSNLYSKGELLKTACGSPCYAAPEMINGKKYVGSLVDIWSSGIILYAMLCGYLPFEDSNNEALYKKISEGRFTIPNYLSDHAKDLLKRILTTDPARRYTFSQIKSHPWFNLLNPISNINDGLLINLHVIPIDELLITQMEEYEFNKEEVRSNILANRHNHITTTYYLLLKNKIRKGIPSIADLISQEFLKYLTDPGNLFSKYQNDFNVVIQQRAYSKKNLVEKEEIKDDTQEKVGGLTQNISPSKLIGTQVTINTSSTSYENLTNSNVNLKVFSASNNNILKNASNCKNTSIMPNDQDQGVINPAPMVSVQTSQSHNSKKDMKINEPSSVKAKDDKERHSSENTKEIIRMIEAPKEKIQPLQTENSPSINNKTGKMKKVEIVKKEITRDKDKNKRHITEKNHRGKNQIPELKPVQQNDKNEINQTENIPDSKPRNAPEVSNYLLTDIIDNLHRKIREHPKKEEKEIMSTESNSTNVPSISARYNTGPVKEAEINSNKTSHPVEESVTTVCISTEGINTAPSSTKKVEGNSLFTKKQVKHPINFEKSEMQSIENKIRNRKITEQKGFFNTSMSFDDTKNTSYDQIVLCSVLEKNQKLLESIESLKEKNSGLESSENTKKVTNEVTSNPEKSSVASASVPVSIKDSSYIERKSKNKKFDVIKEEEEYVKASKENQENTSLIVPSIESNIQKMRLPLKENLKLLVPQDIKNPENNNNLVPHSSRSNMKNPVLKSPPTRTPNITRNPVKKTSGSPMKFNMQYKTNIAKPHKAISISEDDQLGQTQDEAQQARGQEEDKVKDANFKISTQNYFTASIIEKKEELIGDNIRPVTANLPSRNSSMPRRISEEIKTYTGPFDISCINSKPLKILKENLVKIFTQNKITYRNSSFRYICEKNGVKFEVEINKLPNLEQSYILKLKKNEGYSFGYRELARLILTQLAS